ncbi:MAG: FAD-dependent oxidoreductase [Candidatus Staskawiczbacteria bacterium]|nr:FAD-dependent oxidoreductase [Candidatus Staskawiczbacteria bacterium]
MIKKENTYDLIIIGAGPAGVAAGIYAARQKLSILIISKDMGGQVAKKAVDIENYPGFSKISGPDLVDLYGQQLKANDLEIQYDEVISIEKKDGKFLVTVKSGKVYQALSVIVASGAESRKLSVPGEEEFAGKGVSYCSLCDGPLFRDKIVAVVGGGNNGFESALFLSNYVKQIYILEYSNRIKADQENQDLVSKHKNIKIIINAKVLKIEGDTFVNSIFYEDLATNKENNLKIDGVFVEIGYTPSTSFVKDLVDLDEKGEIIFDPKTLKTKTDGIFSAGDCNVSKYKQIIMASGEGAKAALSAYEYIKKQQ